MDASDPQRILGEAAGPVLEPGVPGTFDQRGVMPSHLVVAGGERRLYYTAWNLDEVLPYRNSIGLAVAPQDQDVFARHSAGQLLDRTEKEPHFCAMPTVVRDGAMWRMWYLSCVGWEESRGRLEARYHLKTATSLDGLDWDRRGEVAIDFSGPDEAALVRPTLVCDGGLWRMWFSRRGNDGFRSGGGQSYRLGYAQSTDLRTWTRLDGEAGLDVSSEGWDSEMLAYPWVFETAGQRFMLYNGNGFGRSGFGLAVWEGNALSAQSTP